MDEAAAAQGDQSYFLTGWRIYRKDPGYNAIGMLDTLYFIGGYAVHGYHSVPPYQASHGCARIPLWAAHGVYSRWHTGDVVYVF